MKGVNHVIDLEQLSLEIEETLQRPLIDKEKKLLEWICAQTHNQHL